MEYVQPFYERNLTMAKRRTGSGKKGSKKEVLAVASKVKNYIRSKGMLCAVKSGAARVAMQRQYDRWEGASLWRSPDYETGLPWKTERVCQCVDRTNYR